MVSGRPRPDLGRRGARAQQGAEVGRAFRGAGVRRGALPWGVNRRLPSCSRCHRARRAESRGRWRRQLWQDLGVLGGRLFPYPRGGGSVGGMPPGLDAAAPGRWGGKGWWMSGARVCKKKESLQELTPSVPRHLRPRTLLPGSRAALRAAAAPLSSAHLPGGLGCCPPGPRLRPSLPFLPSRLLGPRNFPECPAGAAEAGGGAG